MTCTYILPALLSLCCAYQWTASVPSAVENNSHRTMVVLRSSLRAGFETFETMMDKAGRSLVAYPMRCLVTQAGPVGISKTSTAIDVTCPKQPMRFDGY